MADRTSWRRTLDLIAPHLLLLLLGAATLLAYRLLLGHARLHWARPAAFYLLTLTPLFAWIAFHRAQRGAPTVLFSRHRELAHARAGWSHSFARLPQVLRLLALYLLICALARPQHESSDPPEIEGIDIIVALDVSHSMSAHDLTPDRLTAAKEVLKRFIDRRQSDRVGLVIFGREAFTQCPLTLDYGTLGTLLEEVRLGLIDGRGTAIGNALGTALNRLRRSDAKSKVVILLTDGDNNSGNLSPEQAARYAQALGIRVFTILMGREGGSSDLPDGARAESLLSPYPVNPRLLELIAQETGGTPYLATDTPGLEKRFQAILDELDRSRFREQRERRDERSLWFILPALLILLAELTLRLTRLRRFP